MDDQNAHSPPSRHIARRHVSSPFPLLFHSVFLPPCLTINQNSVFFIYLYQSYKYKVDYTRVNEFGQGGEEEDIPSKRANKPLTSPASVDDGKDKSGSTKEADADMPAPAAPVSTTASGREGAGKSQRKRR